MYLFLITSFTNFLCLEDSCLISNFARLTPKHLTLLIKSNRSELPTCCPRFKFNESLISLKGLKISFLSFNNYFSLRGTFLFK